MEIISTPTSDLRRPASLETQPQTPEIISTPAQPEAHIAAVDNGEATGKKLSSYIVLYFVFVFGALLDLVEVLAAAGDGTVVAGPIVRWLTLPIEGLFFVGFQYLCWREKVPLAERRAVNAARLIISIFPGLELIANVVGLPIITWFEVLPAKIGSVIALFSIRPLAKRFIQTTTATS